MRWMAMAVLAAAVACGVTREDIANPTDSGTDLNDIDQDGVSAAEGDCDDNDPRTFPDAWDVVGDEIDQNCDGLDGIDGDEDGHASNATGGGDCNDEDPTVFPGADEIGWDLIDQNCDLRDQHDFTQLCAGNRHTCGIDTTGRIRCWGILDERTLNAPPGDPDVSPNDGTMWSSISCGHDSTCAVSEGGSLYCWGVEDDRSGLVVTESIPLQESKVEWSRVFLGHYHGCVIDDTGRAECWGQNEFGQTDVPGSILFKEMGLGNDHTCGIYGSNNIIQCWGDDGQGIRIISGAPDPAVSQGWLQITAGDRFACGIRADLGRDCWGDNDRLDGNLPQNEAGPWGQLSAKGAFVCGIKELEPSCVGKISPFEVLSATPTDVDMRFITGGIDHACGLRQVDGEPVCWGRNDDGQATIPEWPNR